jgi:hypothetical protein
MMLCAQGVCAVSGFQLQHRLPHGIWTKSALLASAERLCGVDKIRRLCG